MTPPDDWRAASALRPTADYVGFWARAGASLIDLFGLLFLVIPLMVWYFGDGWTMSEGITAFVINWILPGVAVLVFWSLRGATPGKMALSAIIVDAGTLQSPTLAQLVRRYLGYYVSTVALGLGFLWIAIDARKQAWHDKMANTVVIRRPR